MNTFIRIEVNGTGLFRAILAPSLSFDYKMSDKINRLADNYDFNDMYQVLSNELDHMYGSTHHTLKHYSHFTEQGYNRFQYEIEGLIGALTQIGCDVTINHTIGLTPIDNDRLQAVVIKGY